MKGKFLALTLSLAAVSFTNVNAEVVKANPFAYTQNMKMLSKAKLPLFKAVGNDPQSIVGAVSPTFVPLTFTQHKYSEGDGIKAKKNGFDFVLEKGSYQIAITGTFQSTVGDISLIDLGLKIGSEAIAVNTNAIETNYDNFQILSASRVIHVDKKTTVSWVARNREDGTSTDVLHRSMSIIKLR